ncbi:hypothetical protein OFD51_34765, partial [Escherichia coli]|nr:hypothetical protein [Escherichia coli]
PWARLDEDSVGVFLNRFETLHYFFNIKGFSFFFSVCCFCFVFCFVCQTGLKILGSLILWFNFPTHLNTVKPQGWLP